MSTAGGGGGSGCAVGYLTAWTKDGKRCHWSSLFFATTACSVTNRDDIQRVSLWQRISGHVLVGECEVEVFNQWIHLQATAMAVVEDSNKAYCPWIILVVGDAARENGCGTGVAWADRRLRCAGLTQHPRQKKTAKFGTPDEYEGERDQIMIQTITGWGKLARAECAATARSAWTMRRDADGNEVGANARLQKNIGAKETKSAQMGSLVINNARRKQSGRRSMTCSGRLSVGERQSGRDVRTAEVGRGRENGVGALRWNGCQIEAKSTLVWHGLGGNGGVRSGAEGQDQSLQNVRAGLGQKGLPNVGRRRPAHVRRGVKDSNGDGGVGQRRKAVSQPFSRRRRGAGEHEAQLPAIVSSRRERARSASSGRCIVEARESTDCSSRPFSRRRRGAGELEAQLPAFGIVVDRGAGEHELHHPAFVSSCIEAWECSKRNSRPLYRRVSRRGRAQIASPGLCLVVRRGAGEHESQLPAFVSSCIEARESTNRSSRPLYRRASRRGRARSASPGLSPRTDVSGYVGVRDGRSGCEVRHQVGMDARHASRGQHGHKNAMWVWRRRSEKKSARLRGVGHKSASGRESVMGSKDSHEIVKGKKVD
ncbi:hypothetical protein B0H13DRAFT_1928504 [Mycena leptocephala]|nr:hypothetical protein B0H13DRAFT_1928504 [Mycena leptocephala]